MLSRDIQRALPSTIFGRALPRGVFLVLSATLLIAMLALFGTSALAMTEDDMYALWRKAAEEFEAKHTVLPPGSEDYAWVERVGSRIVSAWPDRQWVSHAFLVIDEPAPGAWSFPISPVSHRVYVTTGLLEFVRERGGALCDDELAGVLGHEIAHLMRNHHLLRHRQSEVLELETPKDLAEWPARVLGRWQKEDEFEADRYGAFYALHAGYSFEGILRFLGQYMRRYGDDQLLDLPDHSPPRDHPSLSARIAELQREREKIEDAERLFGCGVDLLRVGAWNAARACFAQVRNTFWLSPTVAHNLGYAELQQYESSLQEGPRLAQCVSTSYVTELGAKGPSTGLGLLLAEAKADFLKACDLDREGAFAAPRLGLACAYLYEGDGARAETYLRDLRVGADEPEYLNLTGVLAERSGDLPGAQRAYCKALALSAHAGAREAALTATALSRPYLPALYNLAHLLEAQGRQVEAAQLYASYLSLEGGRSYYGIRARDGLIRCDGRLPDTGEPNAVDSYRGMDLRSSGALVVRAALGKPESEESFAASGSKIAIYHYPSQGISVMLASGAAGEAVVTGITLSEPNRDAMEGVEVGDSASLLVERLGRPREVMPGPGDSAWWDYGSRGLSFYVENGKVRRCLIGGRR